MKRNSIFMWAYISFIFVGIFARLSFDYSLWPPLVLAITLSTILFAFEDLFTSLGKALGDSCDIEETFTAEARKKAEKDLSFLKKVEENANLLKGTEHDLSDIQNFYGPMRAHLEEIMKIISHLECDLIDKRKVQKQRQKAANIFAYLGFLFLFCTLIFATQIVIPPIAQDVFTVLSFAIILMTHQINDSNSRKIKAEMINSQKALQRQEEASAELSASEEKFDQLIEFIECLMKKSEEEPIHAD